MQTPLTHLAACSSLVHVQETSLGMPYLPCKSPLTPFIKEGNRRETMANKVPWFCTRPFFREGLCTEV